MTAQPTSRSRRDLPASASVVIIGGGVIGLSAAYHLAAAGVPDVVAVERDEWGSGSTCRAAGGVRAQFSDVANIELGLRSLHTFERFAEDFGQEIDLHQVGYLFLLDRPEDVDRFERNVAVQNQLGVPSRMLDVAEAQRLSPLISTDGLLAAAISPTDGHCTPEAVVQGYAAAARRAGACLLRQTEVTDIATRDGVITAVQTDRGSIQTDTVICAAGAWSSAIGRMVDCDLPVTPLRRQILTTQAIAGIDRQTPFTIDFSSSLYFHAEGDGMLLGMSDPDETPGFKLGRDEGWLTRLGETIERRVPGLSEVGIRGGWAGLYEVTPDKNALIGEAVDCTRFLYATGFSGHGFLMGPAVGEVLRDLYLGRKPAVDVSGFDVRRFASETDPEPHTRGESFPPQAVDSTHRTEPATPTDPHRPALRPELNII